MPKRRPPTSGYERIAQAEADDDEGEEESALQASITSNQAPRQAAGQPRPNERMQSSRASSPARRRVAVAEHGPHHHHRHRRASSGVDIKAINARLERWAEEIASKLRLKRSKGKSPHDEQLEIHISVFQPPDWIQPATTAESSPWVPDAATAAAASAAAGNGEAGTTAAALARTTKRPTVTKHDFDAAVESVRLAIEQGVQPLLISQGSSGSYFARTPSGTVVGVFKPKDEEPYASRNPKWTKWVHRNLFPFFFGRACLIPNLSYVSEAAAYLLDHRLRTGLVPYTDVVELTSRAFHYDFWDRRAHCRNAKPLPLKTGSFQIFLKGYKDANVFLKQNPWPDAAALRAPMSSSSSAVRKSKRNRWSENCRGSAAAYSEDEPGNSESDAALSDDSAQPTGFWTTQLQQSFREELEKLVILDYIMRNTDRGLDNWMIKIDKRVQKASIVVDASSTESVSVPRGEGIDRLINGDGRSGSATDQYKRQERTNSENRVDDEARDQATATVSIGAIDNSLSWPWKHPDAWRSYPFGWLFLPVSLIGQPFSEATRLHFLPLLTSKEWWSETQSALRRCFSLDPDFREKMWVRQLAVMKGQAWNVVEALKTPSHGPLELTRRARVLVWDDLIDIPVSVRLREPSEEMRRHRRVYNASTAAPLTSSSAAAGRRVPGTAAAVADDDEMDISAARSSSSIIINGAGARGSGQNGGVAVAAADAEGNGDGAVDMSDASLARNLQVINPFNVPRAPSSHDILRFSDEAASPPSPTTTTTTAAAAAAAANTGYFRGGPTTRGGGGRPPLQGRTAGPRGHRGGQARLSFDETSRPWASGAHRKRGGSFAGRAGADAQSANGTYDAFDDEDATAAGHVRDDEHDDEDEDEGDLGYVAAQMREGHTKRVIVERLEMVNSKIPVFTWC